MDGSKNTAGGFDYLKLFVENVSIWEIVLVGIIIWFVLKPDTLSGFLSRITKLKIGDLEVELEKLRAEVAESKTEIKVLENELERGLSTFDDVLEQFDANAPVAKLAPVSEALKSRARSLTDVDALRPYLQESATPEQVFAAAIAIRERRPTSVFSDVVDCLDRLATQDDLGGIRLHTVWTLTSALHRILIAAIRDGAEPEMSPQELRRASVMLDRLEQNRRVQRDRPDDPDKGVRGPIRFARNWIERGLAN